MTWFLSAGLMIGARFILRNILSRRSWWGIPLIVVGSPNTTEVVVNRLKSNRRLGLRPVCTYDPHGGPTQSDRILHAINNKDELIKYAQEMGIKHIVFTDFVDSDLASEIYWMRDIFPHMLFILSSTPFSTL